MAMISQLSDMTSSLIFLTLFWFSCQVELLIQVSCQCRHWFWSYDSFFSKGLTRNLEIGNIPVWVLPNIWRLGRVTDTKFDTSVSNRMLLKAAKFQGYSFYRSCIIKGKPTGGLNVRSFFRNYEFWSSENTLKIRCHTYILMKKVIILRKIHVKMKSFAPP